MEILSLRTPTLAADHSAGDGIRNRTPALADAALPAAPVHPAGASPHSAGAELSCALVDRGSCARERTDHVSCLVGARAAGNRVLIRIRDASNILREAEVDRNCRDRGQATLGMLLCCPSSNVIFGRASAVLRATALNLNVVRPRKQGLQVPTGCWAFAAPQGKRQRASSFLSPFGALISRAPRSSSAQARVWIACRRWT